jgi:hypothetical protein
LVVCLGRGEVDPQRPADVAIGGFLLNIPGVR